MSFYTGLQSTALRLLTTYGQSVTLRDYGTLGTYDTSTGVNTRPSPTDTTRMGALFDYKDGDTREPNSLAQAGDKQLLLDAIGSVPTLEDKMIVGGILYSIVSVQTVSPAGTPVLYELRIRP